MTAREKIRAELRTIEVRLREIGSSLNVTEDEEELMDLAADKLDECQNLLNNDNDDAGLS